MSDESIRYFFSLKNKIITSLFYWIIMEIMFNILTYIFYKFLIDWLVGESSGRASRTIAKHIPGPNAATEALRERAATATSDVALAHQLVMERGDKLSQLEDRTARMMNESENFAGSAHGLMLKYKDKKWYQLWNEYHLTLVLIIILDPFFTTHNF